MIVSVVNPHGTRGPMGQAARLQPCPSANWRKCHVGLDSFGSSLRLGRRAGSSGDGNHGISMATWNVLAGGFNMF